MILIANSTEDPLTARELVLLKQIVRIVAIAAQFFTEPQHMQLCEFCEVLFEQVVSIRFEKENRGATDLALRPKFASLAGTHHG